MLVVSTLVGLVMSSSPTTAEEFTIYKFLLGIITALITIVSFFAVRTLKGIDLNQSTLTKELSELKREFYILEGEHIARKKC
jgi:hypothetical protein